MTVIDRLRAALPGSDDPSDAADDGRATLRSGRGPAAPSSGWSPGWGRSPSSLVPVVLAWLLDPLATGSAWPAVGTGAALWLLVSGAHLDGG